MGAKTEARTFDFYVLLFFGFSFIGWIWEVGIYLVTEHIFVNRGIYRGPYLPVYGTGGLLLWFLLRKLSGKPIKTFLLSALICSAVEYAASFFLEWRWGLRWWDYTGYFLNLNGRICLLSAAAFGLAGTALDCILMPCYMRLYHKMSRKLRVSLSLLWVGVFVLDAAYCAAHPNIGSYITSLAMMQPGLHRNEA